METAGDSPHQAAATRAAPAWWLVAGTFAAYGWAIGVLIGAFRLGWGYVAVARLRRSFEPLPNARLEMLARQAAHVLGLGKAPPVCVSGGVAVPISIGLRKPAIALPKDMAREKDNDRLGAVLLHETAHIARRDHWVGVAQRIGVVLFWWNPLVREISDQISQLREDICDNYVVRIQGGDRFARVLLDMAARTTIRRRLPATVGVLESKLDGLSARIARLMDKERNMATRMNLISIVSLFTCGLALLLGMILIGGLDVAYAQEPAEAQPVAKAYRDEATPASETLLPATTKGFLSITDPQQLAEQWNKTQLGQLIQDPVMKPFADDLRRQFEDRLSNLRKKLGVTLDDLKGVPGGELSVAIIQPAEGQVAVALLVDVTGHEAEAQSLLAKVAGNLTERGAKQSQVTVLDTPVTVFDLPRRAEDDIPPPEDEEPPRQAIYFLREDLLGASDNLEVIKGILGRLAGGQEGRLADASPFRAVMDRCQKDAGELTPQIRWFLEPFGFVRAIRAAVPERDRRRGKTMLDHLATTGFTAIQGLGGFVDFAVEGYEMVHRSAIYAPRPYERSMRMLVFPNADKSEPPPWVPRDLATYTTFRCDILNAFDNFGPLFDEVVAGGEQGVWKNDVLVSLKEDPNGPQIDLREELFRHLGTQVIAITDYQLPISTTSERLLFAVETRAPQAVAKAIEKTLKDEEDIRRREFKGHVIWETIPKEIPEVQAVKVDVPPLGFGPKEEEDEQEEEGAPLLPNMAVTVAHGYLLVASHYDFLVKVLQPIDEREALGRTVDYLLVEDTIGRLGSRGHCLRSFSRTDAEYRPTYELIRAGKMPESRTMLGRVLNTLFNVDQKGTLRKQRIDGSKLPEFDYVRRHLGPAGFFGTSEDDGWFFKGFTLSKEAE